MAHAARMTDTGALELLEREPSLALLAGWAAEARRGDGRLVVLGGEAGVGKTALLERFQRELRDARWSWGACDGLFTPRPLGRAGPAGRGRGGRAAGGAEHLHRDRRVRRGPAHPAAAARARRTAQAAKLGLPS
jgi:hypothetical protein